MSKLLFKDSDGKPSVSYTMMLMTFCVSLLWYTVSIINVPHIRPFDVTAATGFLTPMLTLYFSRRWTQAQQNQPVTTSATPTQEPQSSSES